jgi:hypothetical protein
MLLPPPRRGVRTFRDDWESGIGSGNFVHLIHEDIGYETRYNHLAAVHGAITTGLYLLQLADQHHKLQRKCHRSQ